ncbi:MAG: HDOD domain-containing protein, partial [Planctomycetota bacterium]
DVARHASDRLPISPASARLIHALVRPDWRAGELADIVRADAALSERLLRAANARRAPGSEPIDTIEQALVCVGPGLTLALAVSEALREPFQADVPPYGLGTGVLWRHSIAAVLATEESAQSCRFPIPPAAYAAALLHDAGKLVLGRYAEEELLERLVDSAKLLGIGRGEARTVVLEAFHAELGALLVEAWGLSPLIAEAVRHHHAPLMASDPAARRLCSQILLADSVAALVGTPCGQGSPPAFDAALAGSLQISEASYAQLVARVGDRLESVLELYA